MPHGAEQTGLTDAVRGRCTDMFSRTAMSVVLGRMQLPDCRSGTVSPWAMAGSDSRSRPWCSGYDGVTESHVDGGQMGVANAIPGPGSENAILGRRQVVQIHRQTFRLQGGAFLILILEAKRSASAWCCVLLEVSGQWNLLG